MLLASAAFALLFLVLWGVVHVVLPLAWRSAQGAWSAAARSLLRRQRVAAWYERRSAHLKTLEAYRPLALVVLAGFVAAGVVGATFFALAELVQERSTTLEGIDRWAWQAARDLRSPGSTRFFLAWTYVGTPIGLLLLVLPVAGVLALRGRRRLPLFLFSACLGGWALNHVLKAIFARARPDLAYAVRISSGYAFPSGHAMMSVVALGALVYVVLRLSPRPAVRSASVALALSCVAAISFSRVYLGAHWLSDIVGGMAAGLVWLATTVAAYEVGRRFRTMRARAPA